MITIRRMALVMSAAMLAGCTDILTDDTLAVVDSDGNGDLLFNVTTQEQADMAIALGTTRAPGDSTIRLADAFVAHRLTGTNPDGLTVHRMPLPYVGIHPGAIHATAAATNGEATAAVSRAPLSEIANSANFHDSLTIWGFTSQPYKTTGANDAENSTIFDQTLLKRIRNWRSAAHWPYGGDKMKFYALAPSMENINVVKGGTPSFTTPPTITYTLPETAAEMRDLLWGESAVVDVEAGPTGTPRNPIASTPREQHLGQDDKMVDITFQHALTAIRFAVGTLPAGVTIKQISLKGVYTRGTFNPAVADAATGTNGAWSNIGTTASTVYSIWPKASGTGPGTGVYIDNDSLFFMIPHTVTEAATLEVKISAPQKYKVDEYGVYVRDASGNLIADGSTLTTHTLKCSLTGDVWKKGYTVTYLLTIGEVEDGYYLVADAPAAHEHSASTTSGSFPVHSYHSYWDYTDWSDKTGEENPGEESKTRAVNWKVVGYYQDEGCTTAFDGSDATNAPSWLSSISGSSSGTTGEYLGGDGAVAAYTIAPQSYVQECSHTIILRNNASVSSGTTLNLSTTSPNGQTLTTAQTANCYIVNRSGSYCFPLVYGCGTVGLPAHTDHTGTTISNSSIKQQLLAKNSNTYYTWTDVSDTEQKSEERYDWSAIQGKECLRAVVVWQDVQGLVSSPAVNVASDLISFNIAQALQPGNAVVALQGRKAYFTRTRTRSGSEGSYTYGDWSTEALVPSGEWETVWTWHIWVTDEVYPNDGTNNTTNEKFDTYYLNNDTNGHLVSITNANSSTSTILPVNLGWVPDNDAFGYYAHREVWVKLQQTEAKEGGTPATSVVKIEQHARQPLITGTSTVYQWGRPTALPMVLKGTGASRTIYDGSGNDITASFTLENHATAGDHITNATKLLRYDGSGDGGNAWFAALNSSSAEAPQYWSSTKTVYDPCPPGFSVPQSSIFTGFSHNGWTQTNGSGLNIYPNVDGQTSGSSSAGGYLYTTKYTDANNPARYSPMVYIPVTREWQGDEAAGTAMTSLYTNNSFGLYWCSDDTTTGTKAPLLWICPQWSYTGSSNKPAIQFGPYLKYSSAQPIRPTGNLP